MKSFGLEAAKLMLGHHRVETTPVYVEIDADKARELARRAG